VLACASPREPDRIERCTSSWLALPLKELGRLAFGSRGDGSVPCNAVCNFLLGQRNSLFRVLGNSTATSWLCWTNKAATSLWPTSGVAISLYFPTIQGIRLGDRFADDCLHRHANRQIKGLAAFLKLPHKNAPRARQGIRLKRLGIGPSVATPHPVRPSAGAPPLQVGLELTPDC
jgi:hypothetical protein